MSIRYKYPQVCALHKHTFYRQNTDRKHCIKKNKNDNQHMSLHWHNVCDRDKQWSIYSMPRRRNRTVGNVHKWHTRNGPNLVCGLLSHDCNGKRYGVQVGHCVAFYITIYSLCGSPGNCFVFWLFFWYFTQLKWLAEERFWHITSMIWAASAVQIEMG